MDDELSGFSVAPNPHCPHIADTKFQVHAGLLPSRTGSASKAPKTNLFDQHQECATCGDADETWVCVACSYSGCSRYKNGHMVDHAKDVSNTASHVCIAISLFDLSCWCFQCDEYVVHPTLHDVFCEMHQGKFGFVPKVSLHSELAAQAPIVMAVDEKEEKHPSK